MLHPNHRLILTLVLAVGWFVKSMKPYMTIIFWKSSFSSQIILESAIINILQCKEVYSKTVILLMVLLGKWG